MRRLRLASAFLLLALSFSAQLTATEPPVGSVWIAAAGGVAQLDRATGALLQELPGTVDAKAVSVDRARGLLWVVSGDVLLGFDLDGQPLFSQPIFTGASGVLALSPETGWAWLGSGATLRGFETTGAQLQQLSLAGEPVAAAVGRDGQVWAATDGTVEALDVATGQVLLSLDLGASPEVRSLAYEPVSGEVWVGEVESLQRFGPTGVLLQALPMTNFRSLSAARPDGLWAVDDGELVRLAPEEDGTWAEAFRLALPASQNLWQVLAPDGGYLSAWVSDGEQIVKVSVGGWIESLWPLGEGASVRSLAVSISDEDEEDPVLAITSPTEGATLAASPATIDVTWADALSGIDPESLRFFRDGRQVAVTCASSAAGAVCSPDEPLAVGVVDLTAEVQDFAHNPSEPAAVRFTITDPDPPTGVSEPIPYTPAPDDRGFKPNEVFTIGSGVEAVNPSTGSLVLSIPMGQVYSVGPFLSYQMGLVHSSNVWEHAEIECTAVGLCQGDHATFSYTSANPGANAGFGWELHFGQLYDAVPPAGLPADQLAVWPGHQGEGWLYVAPDGSTHDLVGISDRPSSYAGRPVLYSKDGSFLRMRQPSGTQTDIEHPDGTVSVFEQTGSRAGTLVCGGGVSGCWRFKERRDPYGNKISVTYTETGVEEKWTVSDSTGRSHSLTFRTDASFRAGADAGSTIFKTPDGDEWGDLRRVLTSVDVAAFGDTRAVYNLTYTTRTLPRPCRGDWNGGCPSWTLRTKVLDKVTVPKTLGNTGIPDAGDWEVSTYLTGTTAGLVQTVGLPTGGSYNYKYGNVSYPTICDYSLDANPYAPLTYTQMGVTRRKRFRADNTLETKWIYTRYLDGETNPNGDPDREAFGPDCNRATTRRTEVKGRTVGGRYRLDVHYQAVAPPLTQNPTTNVPITSWQVTDAGLPYTKDHQHGGSTSTKVFLSRQVSDCPSSGQCTKKESHYVRYAMQTRACGPPPLDPQSCYQLDPVVARQKVVYNDDGNRFIETVRTSYDGAGHFETETVSDSFSGSLSHTTETDYTASAVVRQPNATTGYLPADTDAFLPAASAAWILQPYSKVDLKQGGSTHRTEVVFDNKGQVKCTRKLESTSSNPTRGPHDLVRSVSFGTTPGTNAGLPITEILAGGDHASLSTNTLCSTTGNTAAGSRYVTSHSYKALQRLESFTEGVRVYKVRIDAPTGLVSGTFNPSQQLTKLEHDQLARLVSVEPTFTLGEASTSIVYQKPAGNPKVLVKRKEGATVLTDETYTYGDFGRLWLETRRRPVGTSGSAVSSRRTTYDALGRVRKLTTWQNGTGPLLSKATEYLKYDVFDRPLRIEQPDAAEQPVGKGVATFAYSGGRLRVATTYVAGESGHETVKTKTFTDALGRTTEETVERVASGFDVPVQATFYSYDPEGNTTAATRTSGGACSGGPSSTCQIRFFDHDGRGFLSAEHLPELGAAGSPRGDLKYERTALGALRTRNDGERTLTYDRDGAGRLVAVRVGAQLWKEFEYGTTNVGNNYQQNKLIRSRRHNFPTGPDDHDWVVEERYEYRGALSQVSQKDTQVILPTQPPGQQYGETFRQSWTYDELGNVKTRTYPVCITTPQDPSRTFCDDGNDQLAPAHTVSYGYNQGMPVSVTSNLGGVSATTYYHPNFQISKIDYSNNTHDVFDQGTNGMARPRRIRVNRFSTDLFDTGIYEYDLAGNIHTIGADTYAYDTLSRLTEATVKRAAPNASEAYTYDTFGNIKTVTRDGGSSPYPWAGNYDVKNRHLGGFDILYDMAGNQTSIGTRWSMAYDALDMQWQFQDDGQAGLTVTPYDTILGGPTEPKDYRSVYGPGNYRLFDTDLTEAPLLRTVNLRDLDGKVLRQYKVTALGDVAEWDFEKDFIYGADGVFATRDKNAVRLFLHQDHLGSRRLITNAAGTVVGETDYYPFGYVARETGTDEPTSKFTGHERDEHGFTDYMLGRTCEYPFMRFASVDPGRDGWNLYLYAATNPIKYVDSKGASPAKPWWQTYNEIVDYLNPLPEITDSLDRYAKWRQEKQDGRADFFGVDRETYRAFEGMAETALLMAVTQGASGGGSSGMLSTTRSGTGFTRLLRASDFGARSSLEVLEGTLSLEGSVATVSLRNIQGNLGNPVAALNALKQTARQSGASTLRIEGTVANPRLFTALERLLGTPAKGTPGGPQDIWIVGL